MADCSSSIQRSFSSWQLADSTSDRLPPVTVKQNGAVDDVRASASATYIIQQSITSEHLPPQPASSSSLPRRSICLRNLHHPAVYHVEASASTTYIIQQSITHDDGVKQSKVLFNLYCYQQSSSSTWIRQFYHGSLHWMCSNRISADKYHGILSDGSAVCRPTKTKSDGNSKRWVLTQTSKDYAMASFVLYSQQDALGKKPWR